jgi:hypothetical protein
MYPFSLFLSTVGSAVLIGVAFLGVLVGSFLYDYRECLWYKSKRERRAFHCNQCDAVFSVRASKYVASCPVCSAKTYRLQF